MIDELARRLQTRDGTRSRSCGADSQHNLPKTPTALRNITGVFSASGFAMDGRISRGVSKENRSTRTTLRWEKKPPGCTPLRAAQKIEKVISKTGQRLSFHARRFLESKNDRRKNNPSKITRARGRSFQPRAASAAGASPLLARDPPRLTRTRRRQLLST